MNDRSAFFAACMVNTVIGVVCWLAGHRGWGIFFVAGAIAGLLIYPPEET